MAVTGRFGIANAACAFALAACSSHHTPPSPSAGAAAPMAGRASPAGSGSAEAGREVGPAITPPGARATALLVPVDPDKRDAPDRLEARANFSAQADSVDLQLVMVRGCAAARMQPYPLAIKEGRDCSAATLEGPNWDAPRGEGIPSLACVGRSSHTRSNGADKPWTIGGPVDSDILGHAFVIHDPSTLKAIACGVIERAEDAPYVPPSESETKLEVQAQIAGICLTSTFSPNNTRTCPDPAELVKCSNEHCNLGACLEACKDFTACMETKSDPCASQFECDASDPCIDCQSEVGYCSLSFCLAEVSCAPPPTPDGPCAQLAACCQMQGDEAPICLETLRLIERISGDVSCRGVMMDWDTVVHLTVPCKFD